LVSFLHLRQVPQRRLLLRLLVHHLHHRPVLLMEKPRLQPKLVPKERELPRRRQLLKGLELAHHLPLRLLVSQQLSMEQRLMLKAKAKA
jgi:hypothetical protein